MEPLLIVVAAPSGEGDPRFRAAHEELAVQAFLAQLAVERLHAAILPRAAGLDEAQARAGAMCPAHQRDADEFRAIVRPHVGRSRALAHDAVEDPHHVRAAQRRRDLERQALARVFVEHAEHLDPPPVDRAVVQEVDRPHVVLAARAVRPGLRALPAALGLSARHLKLLARPQALDSLVIDGDAFVAKRHVCARATVAGMSVGDLAQPLDDAAFVDLDASFVASCRAMQADPAARGAL